MKPTIDSVAEDCPGIDERLVCGHVERLMEDYFAAFDRGEVLRHLGAIAAITPKQPGVALIDAAPDNRLSCTVVAFDYPSIFSLITGLLAATGFSIQSGQVFTYAQAAPGQPCGRQRRGSRAREAFLRRRRIIDHFVGFCRDDTDPVEWKRRFTTNLTAILRLMETGRKVDAEAARHRVNDMVARRLSTMHAGDNRVLYPVELKIENRSPHCTTLLATSQDTPAFLYSLSNALTLEGITIERVRIETLHGTVHDEIDVVDRSGGPILDETTLDKIRFSVLFTKQFTDFLGKAPDPFAALARFEQLTGEILKSPDRPRWREVFSDPRSLQMLAKVLGTSTFLWEDFVRTQYEELVPLLEGSADDGKHRTSFDRAELERRLAAALQGAAGYDEMREALNAWKDQEIYQIDLDHILHAGADPRALAEPLTHVAELVVERAAAAVFERLTRIHGVPRTVGGLPVGYAVFGLGKLGGVALGYASDIELLFVFSDSGETDGDELRNVEFFGGLADETSRFITARQEGIFRVDLRLRPHGNSGPKACSLESFCEYYGPAGAAHSFERLALTRLRFIAGDEGLGRRVERLRDEYVYAASSIDLSDLQELRGRQLDAKVGTGELNAKFSPGALVDLEVYVQILQVMHGEGAGTLQTPRIHQALAALAEVGVLEERETTALTEAYYFLRRLINGLRMLRGNALDLFLPPIDSDEYEHLARRMGYERERGLGPERQLLVDFGAHTAVVRAFIEEHFGRGSLPAGGTGNVADLILAQDPPERLRTEVLTKLGFTDVRRAYLNFSRLAGKESRRTAFARLALLAGDMLRRGPDPDMALNNWERFVEVLPDAQTHFELLLAQPKRLEILLGVFAGSQFLADSLVRNPEFFEWITDPANLQGTKSRQELASDLRALASRDGQPGVTPAAMRRFRRREILRIGTRDICLQVSTQSIMCDLSALAEVLIEAALDWAWQALRERSPNMWRTQPQRCFCIVALGKLGGKELNYSSDIDLLGVYDGDGLETETTDKGALFAGVMEEVRSALSRHTEEGYAYRVDLRLRPYGGAGPLVPSMSSLVDYFARHAALWEVQALLKARPVAGEFGVGERLLDRVRPVLFRRRTSAEISGSIRHMRERALRFTVADSEADVKSGLGGIRDVEFLVQGLELLYLPDNPELEEGNTLRALQLLGCEGILPTAVVAKLTEDYLFLRRVEHFLQILEDRQVHAVPRDPRQLRALSRRMLGPDRGPEEFTELLRSTQRRVRGHYETYLA